MNSPAVQTFLGRMVADRIASKLDTEVEIERLSIDFFNKALLEGFTLYDQEGDTLISARSVDLGILFLSPGIERYRFSSLTLDNATFRIKKISPDRTNFSFVTEHFSGEEDLDTTRVKASALDLKADAIELINCQFSYYNPFDTAQPTPMNFADLDIYSIDGQLSKFHFRGDSLVTRIDAFELNEKSGFELNAFEGDVLLNNSGIFTENLSIQTPLSSINGNVAMMHRSWSDYSSFLSKIRWDTEFEESVVYIGDIGYFASDLQYSSASVILSGKIKGPIANLKGKDVELSAGSRTLLRGNFDILGLPDAENAFLDLRVATLKTDYDDIVNIGNRVFINEATEARIPAELANAGNIDFSGSFTGFPQDFVAFGSLNTDAGILDIDLNLKADEIGDGITYKGSARAVEFNIGRLLAVESLGEINAEADIKAYSIGELRSANLDGKIADLEFKGYTYRNIYLNGEVAAKEFNGTLESDDPNLNFEFDGIVDFSGETPIMNFYAEIYNIDLTALNLYQSEEHISFSTDLDLRAQGGSLNTFNGSLTANKTYLCRGDSVVFLDQMALSALGDRSKRKISFTSDIADISITGAFDTDALPASFQGLVAQVLPSLIDQQPVSAEEKFAFSINYKGSNVISGTAFPGLIISPNTTIYGEYNSEEGSFGVFLRSPEIRYKDYGLVNATVDLGKISEVMKSKIYIGEFSFQDITLENFDADIEAYNDIIELGMGWFNRDESSQADLSFSADIEDRNTMLVNIEPGYVGRGKARWSIPSTTSLAIDSTSYTLDCLHILHNNQHLNIEGTISENPNDVMSLLVEEFELASVDTLFGDELPDVRGKVNLQASLSDFYKKQKVLAQGLISGLTYADQEVGDLFLSSTYSGKREELEIDASLKYDGNELLNFEGGYDIREDDPLHGDLSLNGVDLTVLNAFDIPEVNHYSGSASGKIKVNGDFNRPALDGYVDFNQAKFLIEYLNTYFTFSDRVRVEDGWFGIDYKPIYDERGKKGFIVASAFHENFREWSYDIDAEVNNFFLMNTTRELNNTYFGTAYGSGTLQLGGYPGFLEINIDAETARGTSIKLPLDESEEVTLENFVYFVNKERDSLKTAEREAELSGIQLRLNLDATPDAEVQIIFDEASGDIIRGRGAGRLTFELTKAGDFLMFGRYEIAEGDYLFTLKNLVNKRFQLRNGGTIGWYGDPYNADIDLSASYVIRTPLYPIMLENRENYRGRTEVDVVLNLQDKLLNPAIGFDIELPQSTENERAQLESVISTTQQLNQQVFALLILNKFLPVTPTETTAVGGQVGAGTATTSSEFISNQISSWLTQISQDFDIGVNYRPGDEISNQEIAVALSTQLFNERLYVRGNFGVTQASETQYTQGQSGFLGDFLVEYMLTDEGKIRLKVFNETNPYEVFSTSSSIYTQGVGLVYQEDFDTLGEFFNEIGSLFTNDKVTKQEPIP